MKYVLISLSFLILFVGCGDNNSVDQGAGEFSSLNGNDFVLEADRILSATDVQFPGDELQESNYEEINDGTDYNVSFSENGQTVVIEPGSIHGQKTNDGAESIIYELDEDTFAGGRFVVWENSIFDAELTIYGSGVPIVKSERGSLTPIQ